MPVNIRPARNDDAAAVLRFWSASAYGVSPTDDPDGLTSLLAQPGDGLLLAVESGEIIGTIIAGWDGWRGNLYRLAVLQAHRRKGVAGLLVREAEKRLREKGARRIGALVEVDNEPGRAFWASQGYDVASSQTRFVKDLA